MSLEKTPSIITCHLNQLFYSPVWQRLVCTMAAPTLASSSSSSERRNALQSSPSIPGVSFTCTICYEDFDPVHRPPMVLPCGHTYVCLLCTKQIKRCMECREPLHLIPPSSNDTRALEGAAAHSHYTPTQVGAPLTLAQMRSLRREATRSGLSTCSTPNKNKASKSLASPPPRRSKSYLPLPIPKNLVLLALMEQRQPHKKHSSPQEPCIMSSSRSTPLSLYHSNATSHDDEEDDLQQTFLSPPPMLPRSRSAGLGFETTLLHSDEVSVVEADEEDSSDEHHKAKYPSYTDMEMASNLVVDFLSKAFQAASLARSYSMQCSSKDEADDPVFQWKPSGYTIRSGGPRPMNAFAMRVF